uniref:DOCKER domain-containing protein n=1 Tax=Globodera rostochiensis TaxID=31243 RepID=A0A914I4Z4_GLORO
MAFVGSDLCEFAVLIFVDMLATELRGGSADDVVVVRRRKKDYDELLEQPQKLFSDVFISRLDPLLDSSLSDALFAIFRKAFSRTFQRHCLEQIVAKQFEFSAFVQTVDRLLELFTAYRSVQHGTGDEMAEMGMFCTAQLVDFYQSIEQHELYVLYLYKLYTLHRTVGNWVEAGLTLKRHADLLRWSASHRPDSYLCGTARNNEGGEFGTELELKEYIYKEMAELFTRGEHWELAIETNRELANIYETTTFDYAKLADLLTRNAALYEKVTKTLRMESHYFMIAFYGKGCPSHLANHKFVARGRPLEQWGCFKQRLMANFSDFKFVDTVDNCEETYRELDDFASFTDAIQGASWYYKHHRVQRFELVRRAFRADTKWTQLEDNETTRLWLHKRIIQIQRPLPDLLSLGPVVSELELDPLNPAEVAIEKMREANDKLAETAAMVGEGFAQSLVNLAGMIRGVVQADVGGGIRNYQAFFSEESRAVCTEDERHAVGTLKQLILEQTALLEYALFIHSQSDRAQANAMFHNSLAGSFMEHRQRVEHWLGPVKSVLPEKTSIYVLEPSSDEAPHHFEGSRRQVAADQSPTPPTQKAPQKIARIASMHENGISNNNHQQQVRPTSMGSASGGSSSSSTNVFKNSNLGAALIKTTIQAKAKLKQKASRKGSAAVAIRANSIATPATTQQQLSAGHEFLSAISQARQSDTSMDTFLLEMEPPLPPRLSKAHSDQIVTNLRIRRQ